MSIRMSSSLVARTAAITIGLSVAALGMTVPASAAPAPTSSPQAYAGSSAETAANKAFFEAVMKSVAKRQAANPTSTAAVTVYYNSSSAPTFASQISSSTSIWNGSVYNVRLARTTGSADFYYYEGNDTRGSYASTDDACPNSSGFPPSQV